MRGFAQSTGRAACSNADPGEVAEWSNAPDSKSGIRVSRIEGSNPSLSARTLGNTGLRGPFCIPTHHPIHLLCWMG